MTIVKRLEKGSELTHAELDGNFTDLDTRVTAIEGSSGLSNVVEDTTPQLGGVLDTNGNNITFSGNTKAQFGASQDLSIFHNNNHSIIRETGTGSLYLQSDDNVILSTDSGTKKMVKGVGSGEVVLYHNDIKKFETTADGVEVTGTLNGHTIPAGTGTLALLSDIGGGGGATNMAGLTDVDSVDTVASGDFLLYDGSSTEYKFVAFEAEVNGLIDSRTGSSGHISTQSQYAGIITTDPTDPTDTAHHILGNTGSASVHNTSTGWYYGDVVSDPANPTTSVVLDIDQQRFTGAIATDFIDLGSSGSFNAQAGATLDLQGTTVHFGSATIAGGNAFDPVINTHLWSGSTQPTNGYVLSWNTALLGGNGDYEWVAQSGGGATWATLGDKDGANGPSALVLGRNAIAQGSYGVSLGNQSLTDGYGIAIGMETQAAGYDVNVGSFSGKNHVTTDHGYRVAVGAFAQQNANPGDETGVGAIAVGTLAGDANQGANAVAIGRYAGRNNQAAQSIVLNATGVDLENLIPDSFVVKPIRQQSQAQALFYDPASGEVTYDTAPGGGGLTNVVDISTGARVDGVLELSEGVNEKLSILTGATGVVAHDCNNGYIFRHTTPAADFTANLTNFYCNNNHVTSVSIMIIQGATAYIPNALQISGTGQTIKWQGGSAPTGNANKTDVFTFTITNLGASYDVIAQLVDFG